MPKSYLLRIAASEEETWRKFHSACVLKGVSVKEAIFELIRDSVKEGRKEQKKRSGRG